MAINIKTSLVILLGLAWFSSAINANPVRELKTQVNSNDATALSIKTKRDALPFDVDFPLQLVNSKFIKSIRDLSASGIFDGALENIVGQVTHNIQKRGVWSRPSKKFRKMNNAFQRKLKNLRFRGGKKTRPGLNDDDSRDSDNDASMGNRFEGQTLDERDPVSAYLGEDFYFGIDDRNNNRQNSGVSSDFSSSSGE